MRSLLQTWICTKASLVSPAPQSAKETQWNYSTQSEPSMVDASGKQLRITRLKQRHNQHLHANTTAVASSFRFNDQCFLHKAGIHKRDWAACYSEKFQLISPIAVKNQSATTNAPKAQLPPLPTAHSQTKRPMNANTIWIKMSCSTGNARSRSLNMDQQIDHSFHH